MSESPPTPGWGPEPAVPSPPRRSAPPGVRISLGGMLWITGAAALIVAALFAFPPVIAAAIASLMSVAFPAMLVGCLLYGSPPWKANGATVAYAAAVRRASSFRTVAQLRVVA